MFREEDLAFDPTSFDNKYIEDCHNEDIFSVVPAPKYRCWFLTPRQWEKLKINAYSASYQPEIDLVIRKHKQIYPVTIQMGSCVKLAGYIDSSSTLWVKENGKLERFAQTQEFLLVTLSFTAAPKYVPSYMGRTKRYHATVNLKFGQVVDSHDMERLYECVNWQIAG